MLTPGQMRAIAGAGNGGGNYVDVNVINNAPGTSVETSKRWSGSIDTHEIIISAVGEAMANGRLDGPLRARFGQQVQPRGR